MTSLTTFFGNRGTKVPRGDPNAAGVVAETVIGMPTGTMLWLPRYGGARAASDPPVLRLQGGTTYNLWSSRRLPVNLKIGWYSPSTDALEAVTAAKEALAHPAGFDFYPPAHVPTDAMLVLQWDAATPEGESYPLRVQQLRASPDERLKSRQALYVGDP